MEKPVASNIMHQETDLFSDKVIIMAQIINLTNEFYAPVQQLYDDIVNVFGRPCKLYYPPKLVENCPNCVLDPIGQKSSNKWLNGGPMPFPNGSICPFCHGVGGRAEETFITVQMVVHFNPAKFGETKVDALRLANGVIKTGGFIKDLPQVMKCSYLVPDATLEGYGHYKYRLGGEAISSNNIIQGRYFEVLWDRIQ